MNTSQIPRYPVTIDGETAHIGTANELSITLDVLQGQHDRAVLEQLRPHLTQIVGGPVGFMNVMKSLESQDQIFLIQAIDGMLPGVLQQARYMRDFLATLASPEVEQCLIDTLGTDGLRMLIVTPDELAQILEWIYGANDRHLIDLLGANYLWHIIRNGYDLSLVLNGLEASGQADLVETLGWAHVARLVSNGPDLAYLMRALPASLGASLLEQFTREQLIELIGNRRDWAYVYDRLEPAEVNALMNKLGVERNAK